VATPDQFIVDNEDEQWTSLEYLRQWCAFSRAIDIATGHFEIGAFLALDGEWQKVDKLRILIGGETSRRTADVIAAALDRSIKVERQTGDMFLTGVEAIVDGIRSGKIEIRTYRHKKFHAKTYITHTRLEVVGSAALVGSSNFTRPGLTQNVELNVKFQGLEVRDLQAWYDEHWDKADPVTDELLTVLEHNAREFTPFEVYIKSLHALTSDLEAPDQAWEESESKIYPLLAPYQREAYHGLRRMAKEWNGGFLTDGVGLGKTFVGLMLAEYYAVKQRRNVLIMATKTGQDAVWEPELKKRLPNLFGRFTNVIVMAHTDLQRQDAPQLVEQLRDRVDVVIVDEAHNFRNHGKAGDDESTPRSRWWRLQEICQGKTVFLLTATPINNSFFDLVHQAELFTGLQDDYFATVGVNSLKGYVARMERPFRTNGTIDLTEFDALMEHDRWLQSIIHQNSRKYAVESSRVAGGARVLFPEKQTPKVVQWSFSLIYHKLLEELDAAFKKDHPLFVLPMYYPLAFSTSRDVDPLAENRQKQVVSLIRTIFLKRFESSVAAFAGSCLDLSRKIIRWLEANTAFASVHEQRLADWRDRHEPLLRRLQDKYRPAAEIDRWNTEDMTEEEFDELNLGVRADQYSPDYRWDDMLDAAFEDLYQLGRFLERIADAGDADDKYEKLLHLISPQKPAKNSPEDPEVMTPEFRSQKVIVFTEFADTARYLHQRLTRDGVTNVDRLDGSRGGDRFAMIQRFAPFYNGVEEEARRRQQPLRVLISTDVLSEGVNLQDGTLLVNYDLHWNPVRLMQRIGRVDRRMNPETEKALVKADPSLKASRGHIQVRNFVPPEELDDLLKLYQRVQNKVLRISKTLGIPGGKLLSEHDMLDDVKVMTAFKEEYEGDLTPLEALRLKWQRLLAKHPDLAEHAAKLPDGISTAKQGKRSGIFLCRRVPILAKTDAEAGEPIWSLLPGRVQWSFLSEDGAEHGLETIDALISAKPDTPTARFSDRAALAPRVRDFERDETKRYRKAVQLPLNAPTPETLCWMEVR
jgi:superfamily II DNA or RNA helicase